MFVSSLQALFPAACSHSLPVGQVISQLRVCDGGQTAVFHLKCVRNTSQLSSWLLSFPAQKIISSRTSRADGLFPHEPPQFCDSPSPRCRLSDCLSVRHSPLLKQVIKHGLLPFTWLLNLSVVPQVDHKCFHVSESRRRMQIAVGGRRSNKASVSVGACCS